MNYQTAKKIDIVSYLKRLGKVPEKTQGNTAWFLSFLRNEKTASLKVDIQKNLFYDFGGVGIGGTIIDLVMHLHNCSAKEALEILSNDTFSFHQQQKPIKREMKYSIKKVTDLKNENLLAYLDERKINLDFARRFCSQVHYTFDNKKEYYGIGFMTNGGGFEIRNKFFKGCLGKKSITTIFNQSTTVSIFESWSDMLAYFTLKKQIPNEDFIILNSTALIKTTLELLQNYIIVKVFMDNDSSGVGCLKLIQQHTKKHVINCSVYYSNFNDLNDYLISLKQ